MIATSITEGTTGSAQRLKSATGYHAVEGTTRLFIEEGMSDSVNDADAILC